LTKECDERFDEAFDKLSNLMERWDQRLTLYNLDLAKRYSKGELRIHAHLHHRIIDSPGGNAVDFCAIFQRDLNVIGKENLHRVDGTEDVETETLLHDDDHQELVFVLDVELMEPPERVVCPLVRAGLLDEVHRSLRRSLYLSRRSAFKFIGTSLGALEHGESGSFKNGVVVGTNHLANEQVEGRAEVVDGVPRDGAPLQRWLVGAPNLKDQMTRIKLAIADDAIRLGLLEPLGAGFKVTDVLFGPFDLYPDATEIRLTGHD
jgi:hypothetical protein